MVWGFFSGLAPLIFWFAFRNNPGFPLAVLLSIMGVILGLSGLQLGIMLSRLSRLDRLFGRAKRRRCPDCGYDLSGSHAEAPLDVERLGVELGPQHCPECGAFWPLVPPAALGPVP